MQYNMYPDGNGNDHTNDFGSQISGSAGRSSPSGEDQDVLRNLVHQTRSLPLDVQRITGPQVKALRTSTRKECKAGVAVTRAFAGLFGGIFSALGGMFTSSRPKNTQCKIYGHTRQAGKWEGLYPKCVNCGIQIKTDDMLKGSTPRPS